MFDFSEEHKMVRQVVRRWVEAELVPVVDALETGALLPYDLIRKLIKTFGIDEMVRSSFRKKAAAEEVPSEDPRMELAGRDPMLGALLTIELSRVSPGFALSFGAWVGLCGGAITRKGTREQRERWALPVLTGEKIGAWAITEPGAGSDAFGGMGTTARRTDGGFVLRGQKTFITNAPHADVFVVYAKLHDGDRPMRERPIHAFILDRGMEGLTLSKPMSKMGMRASPTGEVFLDDVAVGEDRLLGGKLEETHREGARDVFHGERTGMAPMAYGIIERCLEVSLAYSKQRQTWGQPIGEYQLVQAKLARMYIHYQNVRGLLFKEIEMTMAGARMTMGEASAIKAYCAPAATEVAMEAVQILGGNGYMTEYRVEQLARDAKLLQIGGGTDEIQLVTCARALLRGDTTLGS